MNSNLGVVMLRTLTASVLLAIVLSPAVSFSQELAKTMQVDALWSQGLTGAGYDKIGMWVSSGGYPYDHIEFENRMDNIDGPSGPYTNHETSTAGVIIAAGDLLDARGIAYKSILDVYDSNGGLLEIEDEANAGMEIASLSFEAVDYYGFPEMFLDNVAKNASNFLFFQSAGNAGDKVSGQGKNNLSIGSVNILTSAYENPGDVLIGNSATGPSSDKRIKPDLVAPGGPFTACVETNGYAPAIGPATSYSAPAAAGVGVLLQQHYQIIHGESNPMSSATLKALLIHSAEEAGPANGPDAQFGWGLINAKRAATYITMDTFNDDVISTDTYSGLTIEKQIYSNELQPIKVTIVWTDPPGGMTFPGDINFNTPKLVNDLDLKILKDGETFYPWTLNPSNPLEAINTTENHLDNVEQVYIPSPTEGTYTVHIDHDGTLTDGYQKFSLIVTGDSEEPTPRALKQELLYDLEFLYASYAGTEGKGGKGDKAGKGDPADRLKKSIEHVEKSLKDKYWEDDFYLTKEGKKVFDEEKNAVKDLKKIIKEDKNPEDLKADVLDIMIGFVDVDETLAKLELDDAIENNGDPHELQEAQKDWDKAQEEIIKEHWDHAIDKFKKVWEHAYKALENVGLAKFNTASEMAEAVTVETPTGFSLDDNYPNPFNPTTTISFNVPEYSDVSVAVYNLMGEKIRTLVADNRAAGNYKVNWDGTDSHGNAVSTGMYFYELKAGDFKQVKRMTFMK